MKNLRLQNRSSGQRTKRKEQQPSTHLLMLKLRSIQRILPHPQIHCKETGRVLEKFYLAVNYSFHPSKVKFCIAEINPDFGFDVANSHSQSLFAGGAGNAGDLQSLSTPSLGNSGTDMARLLQMSWHSWVKVLDSQSRSQNFKLHVPSLS